MRPPRVAVLSDVDTNAGVAAVKPETVEAASETGGGRDTGLG